MDQLLGNVVVVVTGQGSRPRLVVEATTDIEMYEELLIHYGPDYWLQELRVPGGLRDAIVSCYFIGAGSTYNGSTLESWLEARRHHTSAVRHRYAAGP